MSIKTPSRNWIAGYILIIIVGIYRIFTESVTFDIYPFGLLINQNYAVILYIFLCLIVGISIFTNIYPIQQYLELTTILRISVVSLLILSLVLIFIGTIPAIDQSMDHDEQTEAWNDAFLDGENPYDCSNHKDFRSCHLTVLPGLALLALPAYLLGEVSLSAVLAIGLVIYIFNYISNSERDVVYATVCLGISIPFYFRLLGQSNYFEIIAITLVGIILLMENRLLLSGTVFGVVFATKTNTWPLLPVVAFHTFRTKNIKEFGKFMIPAIFVGLLLHLPFFLWNPYIFINEAPLGVASAHIQLPIPFAVILVPLVSIFVSIITEYHTKSIFAGILSGTLTIGLLFPKRYSVFFVVFLLTWILIIEDDGI